MADAGRPGGERPRQRHGPRRLPRRPLGSPFLKTATTGEFTVTARVDGGGLSGQAQAIRHGISTALQGIDLAFRKPLRAAGFVTRDPRRRERKKPGQAGARKKFAWVKR